MATNIIPGTTHWRASYTPTDASDYNNALQVTDALAMTGGGLMVVDGAKNTATGLATAAASGVASLAVVDAPVTLPAAGVSLGVALAGTLEAGAGALLMSNAKENTSKGYKYGKEKSSTSNDGKKDYTRVTKERMSEMQKKGFDPHEVKPKQGGPGGKIDIYHDNEGNLYYKTEKGTHYESIYDNVNNYVK